ncbi:hypothetical protein SAMN05443668_10718 [Cryptosporangium aurantiacum]|uniref:Uncharacterized protein n=1 Tax=Cryptosporangium aurantiacum TaxID=134849 RepID=A0A1M7TU10_9ACTN|nr:hypothetical protein SAMN05443668_10718 [Cryptosporangium aurantiacum]
MLVAFLATAIGGMMAVLGGRSDQRSPLTPDYVGVSGAGVVALLVLAVWWTRRERPFRAKPPLLPVAAVTVVALVLCTVPLWRRYNTIDVTILGFHRPDYTFVGGFSVWNGSGERLRVCAGETGTCLEGRPVLTLEPGRRGSVKDTYRAGRHALTIVEPGAWARRDTRVRIEESDSGDDDSYTPSVPTQPYVPPPYVPPPVPMVPYR